MYVRGCYALNVWFASVGLLLAVPAYSQPSHAPAGTTAQCRDGSFSQSAQKRGACSRHKGVQVWYGHTPQTSSKAQPLKPASATGVHTSPSAYAASSASRDTMVWVNLKTGVFHCQGSRWYGKTNKGQSMPQAQALAQKHKPASNKWCAPNKLD